MKLLIINSMNQSEIWVKDFVPRVGDKLDVFYHHPFPTVINVLLWPSEETQKALGLQNDSIDAIITVS